MDTWSNCRPDSGIPASFRTGIFTAGHSKKDKQLVGPTQRFLDVGVGASLSAKLLHLLDRFRIDRRAAYVLALCAGALPAGGHALADELGYDKRSAELDSDEFEFAVGFDQKIVSGLTFAFDILGQVDVNSDDAIVLFPGTTTIVDRVESGPGQAVREIDLSNIPKRDNDNVYDVSFGFRYAPSANVILLGNILVPLNNGGLRTTVAPTVGLTFSL